MNKPLLLALLPALCLLPAGARAQAGSPAAGTLTVAIVENLDPRPGRIERFDRDAEIFTDVFSRRKWPLGVKVERFASDKKPDGGPELRVFDRGIYEETPGDLVYHAWMVLYEKGNKHDFGMVTYRYQPRASESEDNTLDRIVKGGAEIAADKVGQVLFPKKAGAGPKG
jgi:hypothetical protein